MKRIVLRTKLCDMLGIEYPIISAGMGPTLIGEPNGAPVELVVAVSEAGGLGVLGGAGFNIDELQQAIREIKAQTDKPFGVDLLLPQNVIKTDGSHESIPLMTLLEGLPPPYLDWFYKIKAEMDLPEIDLMVKMDTTVVQPQEAIRICIEERVPLFCAGLGNPGGMVNEAHAHGMKVLGITGNVKNAKRMAVSGLDLIVAQGHEAGGHTGRIGTMALLPQVIDSVTPIPVLAAGGIGDGRGLAAALAMGCIGVWVGTRFLATNEGGAMDLCKQRILDATDEDTRVSKLYTGKTSRANYTKIHDLWDKSGLEAMPFPIQVLLASALLGSFVKGNKEDYIGGFAGQISGLIHKIVPARQVVEDMVAETAEILMEKLPQTVTIK
ncbi:MAG: 2-nitropropane dioxygenase [Deltaproteobacteria bacterium HGW-Deltaproteobacteria-2]|jgi:NAD(P)H-dependent flavin oxidoreductase YrpB (nitropropane dioxygenase family)|nr:MAG: 2-nitropropane dioxygenase [Deltaproteobacteria bacterium HGW-Deltaproteobacteria-2]